MKIKGKILIIFETSSIRNQKNEYGEVDFGFDFINIKKYINDKNLDDEIVLAVTKFSIDEFVTGRNKEFLKDLIVYKKIEKLPNVNIPNNNFDYKIYLSGKIRVFLEKNKVIIIPYPSKNRLYDIIKRGLLQKKPFLGGGKHSDYGFKDVIIWESILSFRYVENFKKVILVCGDNSFDESCEAEFRNKNDVFFRIYKDNVSVIKEIRETIDVDNLVIDNQQIHVDGDDIVSGLDIFLQSEYFLENVKQKISSDFDIDLNNIKDIEVSNTVEPWIIGEEEVGSLVTGLVRINGIENFLTIFLDDSNNIEYIELVDNYGSEV